MQLAGAVQIYSDAHMACRFAAPHWDKVAKDNKAHANFGRPVLLPMTAKNYSVAYF